jgi:hypothetical protein
MTKKKKNPDSQVLSTSKVEKWISTIFIFIFLHTGHFRSISIAENASGSPRESWPMDQRYWDLFPGVSTKSSEQFKSRRSWPSIISIFQELNSHPRSSFFFFFL